MSEYKDEHECYDSFWKELLEVDGKLDEQLVKEELFAYYRFMDNAAHVYCHCTGGSISKIETESHHVISAIESYYMDELDDMVKEELEYLKSEGECS